MPDELLPLVFRHVDCRTLVTSVGGVRRRWRRMLRETRAVLVFGWFHGIFPIGVLRNVTRQFPRAAVFEFYTRHCLGDAALGVIGANCREVRCLRLYQCHCVTDAGLAAFLTLSPAVSDLVLFGCRSLMSQTLLDIGALCGRRLKFLDVSCSRGVTTVAGLRAIAAGCPNLEGLNLESGGFGVSDNALAAIAQGCPRLKHVDLEHCEGITDAGVRYLVRGCPLLEDVDVSCNSQLTRVTVLELAKNARSLKRVSLGYINDEVADQASRCFGSVDAALYHDGWDVGGIWGV